MISMQAYEQFTRQREKDFAALYKIWNKGPDLPESEIESDIEPAILEVRPKVKFHLTGLVLSKNS